MIKTLLCQGSTYLKTALSAIRVGATADGPKFIRSNGLPPADIVVLPGEPWFQGGVGRCALEFDFWSRLFDPVTGFFKTGRPLKIICRPGFEERVYSLLRHAYEGPTVVEMKRVMTDLPTDLIDQAELQSARWGRYRDNLQLKGKDKNRLPLASLIEIIPVSGIHTESGLGVAIEYLSDDEVRICQGTESETVSMAIDGAYRFPFPLPSPGFNPSGARLAVHTLGCYPGTDPSGGTTCFRVVANGLNYIVDGMTAVADVLHRLGESVHAVEAVCLSHAHQDHIWHAIERMLNGEQIKLICAPPVFASFVAIASAVTGWTEDQVQHLVRWVPIMPDHPVREYGILIEAYYVVGPIPTTGFRFTTGGAALNFSSDTVSRSQMEGIGVEPVEIDQLIKECLQGDWNIVDGGGAGGDPVHGKPTDWLEDSKKLRAAVVMTHTSLSASEVQVTSPGMVKILAPAANLSTSQVIALAEFARQADLKNGLLRSLFAAGKAVQVERGEHVPSVAFVVASGSIAVYEGSTKISILQVGDPFFECGYPSGAVLVAEAPTTVIEFSAQFTEDLIRSGVGDYLKRTGELKSLLYRSDQVHLSASVVEFLSQQMESIPLQAEQMLIEQDSQADYFYVLVKGQMAVVVHRKDDDGQERSLLFGPFGPGFTFGDEALLKGTKRSADVIVLTDGEAYRGDRATYEELIRRSPGIQYARLNRARNQARERAGGQSPVFTNGFLTPRRVVEVLHEGVVS